MNDAGRLYQPWGMLCATDLNLSRDDRSVATRSTGKLSGVRLDLMSAAPTPHDQPQLGLRRTAERHRRAGVGFQDDCLFIQSIQIFAGLSFFFQIF
jgi:hypothetical protein